MRSHNNYNLFVANTWSFLQSWLTCEWAERVGLEMFKVVFLVDWGDHDCGKSYNQKSKKRK